MNEELREEVYQEKEDETQDRQAVSTAVIDDRVTQHLVRDRIQLLSSKTLIPGILGRSQFCH